MRRSLARSFLRPLTAALSLAVLANGCAVGPDFLAPDGMPGLQQLAPRTPGVDTYRADPVPLAWWNLFNDPTLTQLEARAAQSNLDLQAAASRIAQSRAQLGLADARSLPAVGASAQYQRAANSKNGPLVALGASPHPYDLWNTGLEASWEIDLWGHARRLQESARASLQANLYDREAVRVWLSAEIARGYLALRGLQTKLDIARKNRDIASRTFELAQSRVRNGVATRYETAAAGAQLATVEALIPQLEQQRDAAMNALALLLGEPPRTLDDMLAHAMPVPQLPSRIPVGLPSELAQRRPDIQRDLARLHAATANIGAAKADFYPRITLGGSLAMLAFDGADLGNWASRQFSVGPAIHLPVFEGGRLVRQVELTEARQQSAAIAYQQTVLRAWHEIDDALGACAAEARRHDNLVAAAERNRQAFDAARRSYQQGASDYVSVLLAQRDLLSSQAALADSATAAATSLVSLYKALGGGWDPASLPAGPQATVVSAATRLLEPTP